MFVRGNHPGSHTTFQTCDLDTPSTEKTWGRLNYLKPCSGLAVCCCCDPQHCQLAGLRQGELFQTGVCWQVGSSVQRDRWANPAGLGPD